MLVGWHDQRREYGSLIHIDIKDEKIWIQSDGTEVGVANELVEAGVPQKDIVLGDKRLRKRTRNSTPMATVVRGTRESFMI